MRKNLVTFSQTKFWMIAPHMGFGDSRKDGLMYQENGFRIGSIKEDQQYPRNIIAMLVDSRDVPSSLRRAGVNWARGVEEAVKVMDEYEDVGFTMFSQDK